MTRAPQPNQPQGDPWKTLNQFDLSLESQLQRERMLRGLEKLKKEGNADDLYEAAVMLTGLVYSQKAAMNYLAREAADNLIDREFQA